MPNNLVLVRHGESEANIVQRAEKDGSELEVPEGFYDRHDWEHRLSLKGVGQAKAAGAWLLENVGEPSEFFDRAYVSTFIRARETAVYVGGTACKWIPDDRLRERDWGIYGATPLEERRELFSKTERLKDQSYWYTSLDGGESMASEVLLSTRDMLGTFHRDLDGKNAIVVTHGDRIGSFRFCIENMLPEEWEEMDRDKSQRINNCSLVFYSREHPENKSDVSDFVRWLRIIYPDQLDNSPFGGEWIELAGKRRFSSSDLMRGVERVSPLFKEEDTF